MTKLQIVQDINEEEISTIQEEEGQDESSSQLKWLRELKERAATYLKLLPRELTVLKRSKELISNPLFRFLEREVTVCSKLLVKVRKVLNDLIDMVDGKLQPLQELKNLAQTIYSGSIPKYWKKYVVPPKINISVWIQDFRNRL